MTDSANVSKHIVLTSHPSGGHKPAPLVWGAPMALKNSCLY